MGDGIIRKLFISHMWKEDDNSDYYRLERLLNESDDISWENYSAPEHDPLGCKSDNELKEKLNERISKVDCFLIISGMYVIYRKWIKEELDIALSFNKPIIGLKPRGQILTPRYVQDNADEMVGWNTGSIVDAIRKLTPYKIIDYLNARNFNFPGYRDHGSEKILPKDPLMSPFHWELSPSNRDVSGATYKTRNDDRLSAASNMENLLLLNGKRPPKVGDAITPSIFESLLGPYDHDNPCDYYKPYDPYALLLGRTGPFNPKK
jgi:hypothetical protein